MSVPVKIDIQASGPQMEHAQGRQGKGHGAFAHILGHEMEHAQGRGSARQAGGANQTARQQGQTRQQQASQHSGSHLVDQAHAEEHGEVPSLDLLESTVLPVVSDSEFSIATTAKSHTPGLQVAEEAPAATGNADEPRARTVLPNLPAVAERKGQTARHATAADMAPTQSQDGAHDLHHAIPDRKAPNRAATNLAPRTDSSTQQDQHETAIVVQDDRVADAHPFRSTLHMWDPAQPTGTDKSKAPTGAAQPAHAQEPAIELSPHRNDGKSGSHETVAPFPIARDLATEARGPSKGDKATRVSPAPNAAAAQRDADGFAAPASTTPSSVPVSAKERPAKSAAPIVSQHVPAAPETPIAEASVSTQAAPLRSNEPETKTRTRSPQKLESEESPRRSRTSEAHPDLEAAILATLSSPSTPVPPSAPEPSAPAPTARSAAPQRDVRPHVISGPASHPSGQTSDDKRELGTQREKKHDEVSTPAAVANSDTPAPTFAAHFSAPATSSTTQPKGEIPPPAPPLPVEAAPLANRIAEDPGLSMAVMPQAARLAIDSPEGDLELRLRLRDGSADISVSGSMAPLFDHRAPEVRAALASEGLGLGHYDLNQQGNQGSAWQGAGQGGQQGQWQPPPEHRDAPAPGPAPAKAAGVARTDASNQSSNPAPGHIHVTA
jgi:hypothetical protein